MSDVSIPDPLPELLTREDSVELIRRVLGIPVPLSRFEKDAISGRAPEPDAYYGRRHLYSPQKILDYGRSLLKERAALKVA